MIILTVKTIITHHGRHLKMLNGYAYCKHHMLKSGRRWQCTKSFQNCLAYLIIDDNEFLVKSVENHNHIRPQYYRNKDGTYVKIG